MFSKFLLEYYYCLVSVELFIVLQAISLRKPKDIAKTRLKIIFYKTPELNSIKLGTKHESSLFK